MNDKMKKASALIVGTALGLSLVSGCAKAPAEGTAAVSSKPTQTATAPAATTKPTGKPTTAPSESKATTPSATTLPPETEAPTETTAAPTAAPTEATAAPTEAPTTAPTEAPTEATEAPTEAPKLELDYDEAMAAGNAFGVSEYGWIYDPNLGWNDGYEFASWYSLEEIAEGGGQSYLNNRMARKVRTTYETFVELDGTAEGCAFNCYCYESNGFVYFYVFYG